MKTQITLQRWGEIMNLRFLKRLRSVSWENDVVLPMGKSGIFDVESFLIEQE